MEHDPKMPRDFRVKKHDPAIRVVQVHHVMPGRRLCFIGTQQQIDDVRKVYGDAIDYHLQQEIPRC